MLNYRGKQLIREGLVFGRIFSDWEGKKDLFIIKKKHNF